MYLRALVACTERGVVLSCLAQGKGTIWPAAYHVGVLVVLPVVLPKADGTDFEAAALTQSQVTTTRTRESSPRFRTMHN
jgi:hypothetical protein